MVGHCGHNGNAESDGGSLADDSRHEHIMKRADTRLPLERFECAHQREGPFSEQA